MVLLGGDCGCSIFSHFVTMVVCIIVKFMPCSIMVSGFVPMFVVYLVLLNVVCFLSLFMYS